MALVMVAGAWAQERPETAGREQDRGNPAAGEKDRDRENVRARQAWFLHGRTVVHGSSSELLLRAYQAKMQRRAAQFAARGSAQSAAQAFTPVWTNVGPAPATSDYFGDGFQNYGTVGGRVTAVAVDPTDSTGNTVYIGAAYGGVWKSTNAANALPSAVNWTALLDDQSTLAVGAVAVKPDDGNTVLVGTGEPNFIITGDSYYGLGILRSSDGGTTWTLITSADGGASSFSGNGVSKIAFSTANSSLVVAAFSGLTNAITLMAGLDTTTRGLYYSTNAGASWSKGTVRDGGFAVDAASVTDVVYNAAAHQFYAAVRFHGIFSSSDGVTWNRLAAQPAGLSTLTCPDSVAQTNVCPFARGQIAVRPGANEMYVWFVTDAEADEGIYRSTDGGATWTTVSVSGIDVCGDGTSGGCGTLQGTYNLYLSAVPNGSGTDLYAGAINIYKCSITASNTACTSPGWLNLTHAYGCGQGGQPVAALAHVHPDQHGIDFSPQHPQIIYFGNDGGIYRTLNGPGLNTGSCSGSNPFDNLNATLGSTLQFYSLSSHPTDPTALLGGTQDNGSLAVSFTSGGNNGVTWSPLNAGDGGYAYVDPTNLLTWYTSIAGFSNDIEVCQSGIHCRAGDFLQVISDSTVGNDTPDFYTAYILDPASPSKMILGTCRVWRGNATGVGWNPLSVNFDLGTTQSCTGTGVLIRELAAGGPTTAAGSEVIYAADETGDVFVTTNASGGTNTWSFKKLSTLQYPISGIALDPSDNTGKTAYVAVMGFGEPHVYKTTNGGSTWANFSGDLPDAPADAVIVDPVNPSIVYVGTDVGVFVTSNGGINWTEYGPLSGAGHLPNVAVLALSVFNNGSTHVLRAATHGRGVWQTTLASSAATAGTLTISPSFLTFANQTVGTTSTQQAITVTATVAPVTFTTVAIAATQFLIGNSCGGTLSVGQSCTINIAFAPTAAGTQTGTITLTSNGAGSPQTISLSGNGIVATGGAITPQTGWWWDDGVTKAGLNGIGFFIEENPTTPARPAPPGIFMAGFLYDATGKATWLVSTGPMSGSTYSNHWQRCTGGQALLGVYHAPTCVNDPGPNDIAITFTSPTTGTMTRPDGTTIPITRFLFTASPTLEAPVSGAPQIGWWWGGASLSGTGYGIEIQGTSVFIVAYVYDGSGNPIWYLATGTLTNPTTYTGNWVEYSGGPQLTSPEGTYNSSPKSPPASAMTLTFDSATSGTLTMGSVSIPIARFGLF